MTLPALDRAVLARRLAQVAQLGETYVPKIGQTGQTGQNIESLEIGRGSWPETDQPPSETGQRLSGSGQRNCPAAECSCADIRPPIDSAYARPDGVSQS